MPSPGSHDPGGQTVPVACGAGLDRHGFDSGLNGATPTALYARPQERSRPGFRTGSAAPKEQPPRKLSGKRTAGGRALWKAVAGNIRRRLTEGVSPGDGSPATEVNLSGSTTEGAMF